MTQNMTHTMIAAHAWVESPLQLLCAIEYGAATGIPVKIVPLAGAVQLEETVRELESLGLPPRVSIERPRISPLTAIVRHSRDHWIVGDAYSRFTRIALAVGRLRWLTIVDDGAITMSLVDVFAGDAPLERPDRAEPIVVRAVARRARRRLLALAASRSLEIFSFYPLGLPTLRAHAFEWLRSRAAGANGSQAALAEGSRVILGSAAVVDGLQPENDYLTWLGAQELPATYFPHRRETAEFLARIGHIEGLTISLSRLPIELVLASSRGLHIVSQPSSALATLAIVLSGRDCELSQVRRDSEPTGSLSAAVSLSSAGSLIPSGGAA